MKSLLFIASLAFPLSSLMAQDKLISKTADYSSGKTLVITEVWEQSKQVKGNETTTVQIKKERTYPISEKAQRFLATKLRLSTSILAKNSDAFSAFITDDDLYLNVLWLNTETGILEMSLRLAIGKYPIRIFSTRLANGNAGVAINVSHHEEDTPSSNIYIISPNGGLLKSAKIDMAVESIGTFSKSEAAQSLWYVFGPSNYTWGFHSRYHHKDQAVWIYDGDLAQISKTNLDDMGFSISGETPNGDLALKYYKNTKTATIDASGRATIYDTREPK